MKILLSFLCCVFTVPLLAQEITATLKTTTTLEVDQFVGVDEFNNIYYVKDNIFIKKEGNKTFEYTDFLLGDLSSVDILNPLKIVLFYQDTNTAVVLDNTLSEIVKINFNQITDFRNVQFATTAIDRNFWIYNLDLQQLEVFNYNRSVVIAKTVPVSETVIAQKSNYNFCWLQTEEAILKFNIYGSLMNEYTYHGLIDFAEKNDNLVMATLDGFFYLKNGATDFVPIKLPKIDVKQLYLDIENLYIYDSKKLYHYQLKLPKK